MRISFDFVNSNTLSIVPVLELPLAFTVNGIFSPTAMESFAAAIDNSTSGFILNTLLFLNTRFSTLSAFTTVSKSI